jgi:HK97 family phage prohead protease
MTRDDFLSPETDHTRVGRLSISKAAEGSRVVELSFSSDNPVRRYDWWNDREYDEILGHAKDNVDLSRLNEMGVVLYNHNPDDVRNVVGRVLEAWVDEKDKKCRARVEFDADESADLVFRKVQAGTIRGVSVGYRVDRWEQVDEGVTTTDGIEGPALIARRWTAYEISFAPVPADPTVGPGRSINIFEGGNHMSKKDLERLKRAEEEDEKEPEEDEKKAKEMSKNNIDKYIINWYA